MANAADIGVNASSYTGDANLGGGTFGFVKLDTRPIEDLAKYTMLFNKAEYDQRQKDAEAAAAEIADMTSYDLTTGIPKDAKLLQDKYDKLVDYVKTNPSALDYRNKEQWAEYKRLRNDLQNDLNGAKVRNTMYALRQKEIAEAPTQEEKNLLQSELDADVENFNIRTPIPYSQKYAVHDIKLPDPNELKFDVTKVEPNGRDTRSFSLFNVQKAWANAGAFSIGLDTFIDESTPQGKREAMARKNNFWLQGADYFNSALNAVGADGKPKYKKEIVNQDGTVTYKLDEEALSKMPRSILNLVKEYNKYVTGVKNEIKTGAYTDKLGKGIKFGDGALDEADYREINYNDGVSPEELAIVAQYAKWSGDAYATKFQETDDAIQYAQIATTRRGQDLDYAAALLRAKGGSGEKEAPLIQQPAILFGEHVQRVKDFSARNSGRNLIVAYEGLDDKTRTALGVTDKNQRVEYRSDGSFVIERNTATGTGKDKKQVWVQERVGTSEDLKQGFINAVKLGTDKEGSLTEGFQKEAENGFTSIFGTNSASSIWGGWKSGTSNENNTGGSDNKEQGTIKGSQVPKGSKITEKDGSYYYNGKKII